MPDTGIPETRKETWRRVLAPLNIKHNRRYRIVALVLLLPSELGFVFLSIFVIYNILPNIPNPLSGLPLSVSGIFELILIIPILFIISVPNLIINMISIVKGKTDLFFEISIATAIWAVIFFIHDTLSRAFLAGLFTIHCLFGILGMCIAEVIFYRIRFKKERAKIEHPPEQEDV
jgi:hypothetical protein